MIFILFTASWTTLYAFTAILFIFCDAMYSLAGMASGVVSLMITIIFWVRNDRALSIVRSPRSPRLPSRASRRRCSTPSAKEENVKDSRRSLCKGIIH